MQTPIKARWTLAAMTLSNLVITTAAMAQSVPDTVKIFSGNNLGSTSFYDGFGPASPGFTFLNYFRYDDLTSVNNSHGHESSNFNNPHIQSYTDVLHLSYASPLAVPGGLLGAELLVPLTGLTAHADQPGLSLAANGFNLGDITFGPFYQAHPLILDGRPILSWRMAFDVIAPTGGMDQSDDVNQSSGYWTLNPYLALTVLPTPKWEISTRLQYFHNFSTDRASNPPQIPGFTFENGRAGDAVEMNFASSYAVMRNLSLGINGFALTQIQNDTTNGETVPDSRATELYIGPGFSAKLGEDDIVNFNVYLPVVANNVAAGPQFNLQYIHPF